MLEIKNSALLARGQAIARPSRRAIRSVSQPASAAERLKTQADPVTAIPDDLPDAIAAQLFPNTVIALLLLRPAEHAAPGAGRETPILLTAAGSSVARILTLAGRRRGLKVVTTVRSRKGSKALSARLPDLTVASTANPDWIDQVRRAAGDRSLQIIMDPVGGRW